MIVTFLLVFIGFAVCFFVFAVVFSRRRAGQLAKPDAEPAQAPRRLEALRLPYRYADDVVYVYDTTVWTGFRLATVTDETATEDQIADLAEDLSLQIQRLALSQQRNIECLYTLTRRPVDLRDWVADRTRRAYDPTASYRTIVRRLADRNGTRRASYREVQLHIKLGDLPTQAGPAASMSTALDAAATAVTQVADEAIDPKVMARFHDEAERWTTLLAEPPLSAEQLTREDLLWSIRRPLHGHLPVPEDATDMPHRTWGPAEFDLAVDFRGSNHARYVRLNPDPDDPEKVSYTTSLVIASRPQDMTLTKATAWVRAAAARGVDVTWRFHVLTPQTFATRMRKTAANLTDERDDAEKNAINPKAIGALRVMEDQANSAQDDARKGMAALEGQIRFAVSAPTLRQLDDAADDLIAFFRDRLSVRLERPRRLQWRLLQERLPGNGPRIAIAPYQRLTDVWMFGLGLPNSGAQLGDNPYAPSILGAGTSWAGDIVGHTVHGGDPVHLDWHVGPARNKGAGVIIVGASGGGKTSLALLKYYLESEAGTRVMAFDPKFDFANMCLYLAFGSQVNEQGFLDEVRRGRAGTSTSDFQPINRGFWDETSLVDVTHGREGMLEPFATCADFDTAASRVETALNLFLGQQKWDDHVELWCRRALRELREKYTDEAGEYREIDARPTIMDVLDRIHAYANDETLEPADRAAARKADDYVSGLPRRRFSRIVFSREPKPLTVMERRRTVVTMRDMSRPPANASRSDWTPDQQMSAGVIYLLTQVARSKLLSEEYRDVPMTLYIDEGYVLLEMPDGLKLVSDGFRQMRALRSVIVFITQQASNVAAIESTKEEADEPSVNQVNTVLAFLQHTENDARKVAPMMGLDPVQRPVMRAFTRLRTGRAYLRDCDDRVGSIDVDLGFRPLLAATDTNTETRRVRQSVDPPSDVRAWDEITEEDWSISLAVAGEESPSTDDAVGSVDKDLGAAVSAELGVGN